MPEKDKKNKQLLGIDKANEELLDAQIEAQAASNDLAAEQAAEAQSASDVAEANTILEENPVTPPTQAEILNAELENDQKAAEKSVADSILEYNNELKAAKEEDEKNTRIDRQAAAWNAAGDLAAGIANLVGVSNGASNQQQKTRTFDWMSKADAERDKRRSRMDSLRDKQRSLQNQLQTLKTQGLMNAARANYYNAQAEHWAELDKDKAERTNVMKQHYDNLDQIGKLKAQVAKLTAQNKGKVNDAQIAKINAEIDSIKKKDDVLAAQIKYYDARTANTEARTKQINEGTGLGDDWK